MAKALIGTYTTPRAAALLDEVRALRERVAELEARLAAAESARDARTEVVNLDEFEDLEEPVGAQQ